MSQLKPQDLRYGNLIEFDGKIFTVKAIDKHIVTADRGKGNVDFTYSEINPILLTEEILLKIGYAPYNNNADETLTFDFPAKLDIDFYEGKIQLKSHYEGYHLYRPLNIKYVHEIQNLYQSLGLEELKINLK